MTRGILFAGDGEIRCFPGRLPAHLDLLLCAIIRAALDPTVVRNHLTSRFGQVSLDWAHVAPSLRLDDDDLHLVSLSFGLQSMLL